MKAFVTGGTGFIGRRLVHQLRSRGDEVHGLVRSTQGAAELAAQGAIPVLGDLANTRALTTGMKGCDTVFHVAGWYKLGARDQRCADSTNITGTRTVLTLATELNIPRIVYTSTVAIYGDTHRELVDEAFVRQDPKFHSEYDRTKTLAHDQVVLPLIAQGAPVIITLPGAVFGPGDNSLVGQLMQGFTRGQLIIFPGPDTFLSLCYVDDLVAGLILAAEKGRPGEAYNLTGPAMTLGEAVHLWAHLTGWRAPLVYVPARLIHLLVPLSFLVGHILPLTPILTVDAIHILGISYVGNDDKARRELGWQTRPLEEGFRATFEAMKRHRG